MEIVVLLSAVLVPWLTVLLQPFAVDNDWVRQSSATNDLVEWIVFKKFSLSRVNSLVLESTRI